MSHLSHNLGHRLAITIKNAVPYLVAVLFALFLIVNIPSYMAGTLVAGLSPLHWFGTAVIGIVIVLALFGLTPEGMKREVTHDYD